MAETHDVVVVGSGAAGLMTALRAADLGLDVLVVEKAHKFGGTSATSGGVAWIPNHGLGGSDDTREQTLTYLDAVTHDVTDRERLEAYVDSGREVAAYMTGLGLGLIPMPWPDYFSESAGARADRSLVLPMWDGKRLGDQFPLMREQYPRFKLFNRYAMNLEETFTIAARSSGWQKHLFRVLTRYWMDHGTRRQTKRDRWYTSGAALTGPLREQLISRGVEIRLETRLDELAFEGRRVSGVKVSRFGQPFEIQARHGVVICAGGFEWSQELRDRFYPVKTSVWWSSTPQGANDGGALKAAEAVGAATQYTEAGWWAPTMIMPSSSASNFEETHQAVFDVGRPGSVCVNRDCDRFVDEACSYDLFGQAMVEDQLKTGANTPCWLVFDATFRAKFTAGGFLPSAIMSDRSIPPDWWGHYIFKAGSVAELAGKIGLDAAKLDGVVERMNGYAKSGVDPEFHRGDSTYDKGFGDPTCKPNPCIGPIDKAPYYAIPINLGDLGTKGGLKCDSRGRVVDEADRPIAGLYAAGNATSSPFGLCYPGAGATIGPALVFGYIAASDIAARASNAPPPPAATPVLERA